MQKFDIPKLKYSDDLKVPYSIRLPEHLLQALKELSKTKGWNVTDLISIALDQYVQWETSQPAPKARARRSKALQRGRTQSKK